MSKDSSKVEPPEPEKPAVTWGPFGALLAFFGFMSIQIVIPMILVLILMLLGWSSLRVDIFFAESIIGQFFIVLLFESVTVAGLLAYIRGQKVPLSALGFKKPKLSFIGWALAGYAVYFAAFILLSSILSAAGYIDLDQKQELIFDAENTTGLGPLAIAFFSLVIIPPLVEELMFRGFIFSGMLRKFSIPMAIALTSVLFTVPHTLQSSTGLLWIAGLDTFLLSIVLCTLRIKTGNIWASVLLHGIKNSLAFVSLFILHVS